MTLSINISAENIGVDSGTILLADKEWYYNNGGEPPIGGYTREFNVSPGMYNVEWSIEGTWRGDVGGKGLLNLTSGTLIVSDPGYGFSDRYDKWDELLNKTNFLRKLHDQGSGVVLLDTMGGDGVYDVDIILTPA